MSQQEPPKITFPCPNYPVKIMGDAGQALRDLVTEVMVRHVADFQPSHITVRDSAKGNFQSLTVMITATGEAQLQAIFVDLKQNPIVRMVL